ncbi:ABC transporter ATP-binding protein [Bacillus manliponensis]|nr:ABC transporter ATP-binding protein [Bacillus manliponensis]
MMNILIISVIVIIVILILSVLSINKHSVSNPEDNPHQKEKG